HRDDNAVDPLLLLLDDLLQAAQGPQDGMVRIWGDASTRAVVDNADDHVAGFWPGLDFRHQLLGKAATAEDEHPLDERAATHDDVGNCPEGQQEAYQDENA